MLSPAPAVLGAVTLVISSMFSGRRGSDPASTNHAAADPITILKQRYARGEIDKAQFDSMRREMT